MDRQFGHPSRPIAGLRRVFDVRLRTGPSAGIAAEVALGGPRGRAGARVTLCR
jgi:hypothetical protein